MKLKDNYKTYATGTILLWASAFVFTKVALDFFSPSALGLFRYIVASVVLIAVAIIKKVKLPSIKDLPMFIFSGALGFGIYIYTFNKASLSVSSATGSVIMATAPIFTALLSNLLLKEKIRKLAAAAIGIEFVGILVLTLWNGVFSINSGTLLMLFTSIIFSGYNLTQRELTKKYTGFEATTYSMTAGTILLLVFLPDLTKEIVYVSIKQIIVVIYLGVFPSAIAYMWWAKAMSLAKTTSDVTNFMFITPLISTILGYLIIFEVPTISLYVGGAIIIGGLLLFNFADRLGNSLKIDCRVKGRVKIE